MGLTNDCVDILKHQPFLSQVISYLVVNRSPLLELIWKYLRTDFRSPYFLSDEGLVSLEGKVIEFPCSEDVKGLPALFPYIEGKQFEEYAIFQISEELRKLKDSIYQEKGEEDNG